MAMSGRSRKNASAPAIDGAANPTISPAVTATTQRRQNAHLRRASGRVAVKVYLCAGTSAVGRAACER
jgi:hypothetical protein